MKAGRPRKLSFPIRRVEVWHGADVHRSVEENTTVSCVTCGETFLINGDTAYISRDDQDSEIEMVRCPHCGRRASIYHYYDRIVRKKKSRSISSR